MNYIYGISIDISSIINISIISISIIGIDITIICILLFYVRIIKMEWVGLV